MANTSAATTAIGVVKIAVGDIKVIGVDGIARSVQVGDHVYLGETLQTVANSIVQVQLNDGRLLDLGRDSKIALDNELLAASYGDSPYAPYTELPAPNVANLQEKIAAGADPSQSSEPTAAGSSAPVAVSLFEGGGGTPVVVEQANSYGSVTPPAGAAPIEFGILNLPPDIFPPLQTTLPILPISIVGTLGNDILIGNNANNILLGGKGNDILVGNLGSDTFKWANGDQGTGGTPAIDTVIGFTENVGDKLALSDFLQGEHATVDSLLNYLHFDKVGNDTIIDVKATGAGAVDQRIILQGADLTANGAGPVFNDSQIIGQLLAQGKLQTDA